MLSRIILLLPVTLALAQHHPAPPAEKPVKLLSGLGVWRHPIATSKEEARKYFDQGLALLYGFNRYEALRSFRKAAQLDPSAAMAHWGIAMATGPHINMDMEGDVDLKQSCEAVAAGLKLSGAPPRERAYLEAVATRCPEYKPPTYIAAMRALASRYPDDADAQTFYAESLMVPVRWHWYTSGGTPAEGVLDAEHALESVLRRFPDHPGANHFYIHAVESSPLPERAIASAQRLMGIVPAAGHLVHMPGHIWLVLGDYETAATVNERAAELDREYLAATGVNSSYIGYYVHNLHFIVYARSMQGRAADALRAAATMAETLAPVIETMPDMLDPFVAQPLLVQVRFKRWDDILNAPAPNPRLPATNALWHYARACALAGKGRRAEALREQAAFEEARRKSPAGAQWGNSKTGDVLAMTSEIISARLARTPAAAVPHWENAVAMQDALAYDEPPAWYYPLRESLGAALVRAGKASQAEAVFRDGLRRSPRNGRMLFGLLASVKAQNNAEAAEWIAREYEVAWKRADTKCSIDDL